MESLLLIPAPSLAFGCGEFSRAIAKPERSGEGRLSRHIWAAGQDTVRVLAWAPLAWGDSSSGLRSHRGESQPCRSREVGRNGPGTRHCPLMPPQQSPCLSTGHGQQWGDTLGTVMRVAALSSQDVTSPSVSKQRVEGRAKASGVASPPPSLALPSPAPSLLCSKEGGRIWCVER